MSDEEKQKLLDAVHETRRIRRLILDISSNPTKPIYTQLDYIDACLANLEEELANLVGESY